MNNKNVQESLYDDMIKAGEIWRSIYSEALKYCVPGNKYIDIDNAIGRAMKVYGVLSGPKAAYNYPCYACVSVNSCVCHGVATQDKIKVGDVVSIDICFKYKNRFIDAARTHIVLPKEKDEYKPTTRQKELQGLIDFNQLILDKSIHEANETLARGEKIYNNTFAKTFKRETEASSLYSINPEYGGHGIDEKLHSSPFIYNYPMSDDKAPVELSEGMFICVEPIIALRTGGNIVFYTKKIGLDVFHIDGQISSHIENTYHIRNKQLLQIT